MRFLNPIDAVDGLEQSIRNRIVNAEHHDGITYASCISTGLYLVQLDIDLPYRL